MEVGGTVFWGELEDCLESWVIGGNYELNRPGDCNFRIESTIYSKSP